MALVFLLLMVIGLSRSTDADAEMALANVTRLANGDLFSLVGTDCGVTRCMEVSHGTALPAMGGNGCACQCRRDTPAFREDRRICVNRVDECSMASFGRGSTKPQIPYVFLPLQGQIIYPSKEIVFTDVEDAVCAVTSAQYLSMSGWVTLRDLVDNDVPFGLYRDEGSTYLQWKGSASLHSRLEGRLVAAHVLCSAPPPARLATSCATFRVAGATHNALLDVRSIPFHAGETVTTEPSSQGHGLSVLESLAIGVCVLMLVFIYAAGIVFYIHYKQKQKRKPKDPEMNISNSSENESTLDSRINMDSMRLKTNPLMKLDNIRNDYITDAGLSDVSEQTEDTIESSPSNYHKERNSSNIVSAVIHTKRKKPVRPTIRATSTPERMNERLQRRSASPEMEKAPHSDLSILHCSIDKDIDNIPNTVDEQPVVRRKLYFNPVFFETEHLKNPPPAAIDFLNKLREVMSVAKEKMTSKRFIPNLSDIPEEESYHTIDLGWDIPCAKRGRRFSAISLKRENSRRSIHCGGCPGCDSSAKNQKSTGLMRSNSCKTCVSDDYKQKIVQKWLEDVPTPPATNRPAKIAKVSGTPRVIEPKEKEDMRINPSEPLRDEDSETLIISESILKDIVLDKCDKDAVKLGSQMNLNNNNSNNNNDTMYNNNENRKSLNHATRRVRKKLPPPPPPPPIHNSTESIDDNEEPEPVLPEVKKKMEAVIRELNKCQRIAPQKLNYHEPDNSSPKIIIPIVGPDSQYYSDDKLNENNKKEFYLQREIDLDYDSLERAVNRQRRFSLDFASDVSQKDEIMPYQQNLQACRERLSRSWRDLKNAIDSNFSSLQHITVEPESKNSMYAKDIFVSTETIYNSGNGLGPLTIEVRGSPIEERKQEVEDFDPDTLDRKPKKSVETNENKKCVEKILLKSGGSFKSKTNVSQVSKEKTPPEAAFTRKIGSLRQIYEAKTRAQERDASFYERRGSLPYNAQELSDYLKKMGQAQNGVKNNETINKSTPDIVTNNTSRVNSPQSDRHRSSEERDRFPPQSRIDNPSTRRSDRRSIRARTQRQIKKLSKTEDSGYLSTDSNESKRRARYLMQIKPKLISPDIIAKPVPVLSKGLQIESDTDELESLCDGRSESGGESVETDSVFFGNYNDSKRLYEELRLQDEQNKIRSQEQIDSGFVGETNIILSGDSDSEHKSVISIVTGRDGRGSASSVSKIDDTPYAQSVGC